MELESRKLDIGQVVRQTFAVLGRNFPTFAGLALILVGLPYGVLTYLQGQYTNPADPMAIFNGPGLLYFSMTGIALLIAALILQGALLHATVDDLSGEKPDLGRSLAVGLRAFLPLFGMAIVAGLALMVGFILLIVPGIMLACAWCVAGPALVAERRGVLGSLSRSAELTRGNRWRIFGLFVIVWIAALVIGLVFGLLIGVVFAASGGLTDPAAAQALARDPLYAVFNALLYAFQNLIGMAGIASLYVELRRVKEGAGGGDLKEIFA